jgi:hypothetical protein
LIEPHRTALVDRAIELALKSQDGPTATRALELALSRLAPSPRQESTRIVCPGLAEAITIADKCQAVLQAVAAGDIAPDDAERLIKLLDGVRRAIEHDELAVRIQAALEAHGIGMKPKRLHPRGQIIDVKQDGPTTADDLI